MASAACQAGTAGELRLEARAGATAPLRIGRPINAADLLDNIKPTLMALMKRLLDRHSGGRRGQRLRAAAA